MFKNCILPKLWLMRIPEFWDRKVPEGYPATESVFSLTFESEEVKAAVLDMEAKLNTEESIVTIDMIPENERLGNYLGTYDVTGEPGESVLVSPVKLSELDRNVLVFHYADEAWSQVENVEVKDGYVYATVESFSPFAVFTTRRDTFYQETGTVFNGPTYVANGIPVVITPSETEGNVVVTDANGKVTEVPNNAFIIGGTIDGSEVEKTSVTIKDVAESTLGIISGSFAEEGIVYLADANLVIKNSSVKSIGAGYYGCRLSNAYFLIENSTVTNMCAGFSRWAKGNKDSNTATTCEGLGAKAWVKNSVMDIVNSTVSLLYGGGGSGYSYVDDVVMNIAGSKIEYLTAGGSNGKTNVTKVTITDSEVKSIHSANRGIVCDSTINVSNSVVEELAPLGRTASDVTGTDEKVLVNLSNGGNVTIDTGINGGIPVTKEVANECVSAIKISRTTDVTYTNGADYIYGDVIVIK